jgi:hypothetical protein
MSHYEVKIHIQPPVIRCTPNGGNAHVHQSTDDLRFDSNDAPFTLVFQNLDNIGAPPFWPFREAEPRWPVRNTGALTIESGTTTYLKYTVQAAGCPDLDPIIIIER